MGWRISPNDGTGCLVQTYPGSTWENTAFYAFLHSQHFWSLASLTRPHFPLCKSSGTPVYVEKNGHTQFLWSSAEPWKHMCNLKSLSAPPSHPQNQSYFTALMKMFSTMLSVGNWSPVQFCCFFWIKAGVAKFPSSSNLKERPNTQGLTITSLHSSQVSIWSPSIVSVWANWSRRSSSWLVSLQYPSMKYLLSSVLLKRCWNSQYQHMYDSLQWVLAAQQTSAFWSCPCGLHTAHEC